MKNDDYDPGLIIKIPSALFSTLLLLYVVSGALNYWIVKPIYTLAYTVALVISGWIFAFFKWRIAGFIHAALMFGIAGFCCYVLLGELGAPLSDNPAAGLIAVAALVYFIIGALAALSGIGIAYLLTRK